MNKEKNSVKRAFKLWLRAVSLWWKYMPEAMNALLGKSVFTGLTPYLFLFVQAQIVEEIVGEQRPKSLLAWVLLVLLLTAIFQVFNAFLKKRFNQYNAAYFNINKIAADAFLNMPFANMADSEVRKTYNRLVEMRNWAGMGLLEIYHSAVSGFQAFIDFFLSLILLFPFLYSFLGGKNPAGHFLFSPALAIGFFILLTFLSGLSSLLAGKLGLKFYEFSNKATSGNRLFSWYFGTMTPDAGMEVRIYRQMPFIQNILRRDNTFNPGGEMEQVMKKTLIAGLVLGQTISYLALFFIYGYVSLAAYRGFIGVGLVTQYVGVLSRFSLSIKSLLGSMAKVYSQQDLLAESFAFLDLQNIPEEQGELLSPKLSFSKEISFRNVSFSYPGTERKVLDKVNFTIRPDERLAIVGRNGSGKSTFVKLLVGLYKPDEGQILLDGIPLEEIPGEEYSKILSVVFQDSRLFDFTLGANVALSERPDEEKILDSLDKAGFRLASHKGFAKGLETHINKGLDEDGVTVSGGEAQKILIARALYKESKLLIFDEPTAALDPIAEAEIYTNLGEIIRGRAAIFISHRLSSCRFSERIAVFKEGKIIEVGRHEELLKKEDSHYRELWNAQAQHYTEEEQAQLL